jgi:hypothetical protein
MDFKNEYPEFAVIERQIRIARAERAAAIGSLLAGAVLGTIRGLKHLGTVFSRGLEAERDRRAVEADAFLRRSVPRS